MKPILFLGLLLALGLIAGLLYATLPVEQVCGRVIARRQRVEHEDPTFGFRGSFLGVLHPVFELYLAPADGSPAVWLPCTQRAYHSVRPGADCRLEIRGGLVRKSLAVS